jgi:ArsR family transcriptional regulator
MSNHRNNDLARLAPIFSALGSPHRLSIFTQLASCCAPGTKSAVGSNEVCTCVGELGKRLGIAPSTVSHHVKELRQAGLIRTERQGQTILCWVDPEVIRDLAGFFAQWLADNPTGSTCCANEERKADG